MPLKRRGALQLAQREVDDIEKQVDRLVKDVRNQVTTIEDASRKCQELQSLAEKTQNTLKKLTKADELAPVGNYDQRKQEEETRLQSILECLNNLSLELSPPGPSTTAGDVSKEESETGGDDDDDDDDEESSDDDSSEDDDDDDDEKEKRAVKPPSHSDQHIYTVLSDFKGEEEGDLSVRQGQVLSIIRKTRDGWWLAEDAKGNRGVVPKNFLQIGSGDKNNEDEDDGTDDDDDEESDEEDLQDSEEVIHDQDSKSASHGNWSTVRKALTEIDATDVLSAMGAIPSGFRPSALNKLLLEEGEKYRGSHYIQPELSQSQLSFKDLFLDADTGRVRARQVRICVCFTLWNCTMIPTPGVGVQVLSRHIRLCAFDGTQVLSNIHTVRAAYNSKSPKTWSFSPRMTGMLPTLMNGDCFLRCSSAAPNLGVLFELGVTFIRNSTGERGDLSCGWAFLKLTDDAGNPLPNRTYDLPVNGGTPYEEDVPVEPTITRGSPGGVLQQMLQARRQPKLTVKLKSTNSQTRTQLKYSATLSELRPPAGLPQAAAGGHSADGQAYHAECRSNLQPDPFNLSCAARTNRPPGCTQECLDGRHGQHEQSTEERLVVSETPVC
ncbi:nephrocystin-1 isoform X2 [Salarias fasciatus]|uniref:nephrocystin-1 isoform X2 n=1 Tax=Salarias fasciatus TaxID=181472 RepID=UPI0011766B10|nr:nephrocystin-1 isoform X2 [Salarias fasciatus]